MLKITIAGLANVGKTTFLNAACGSLMRIGNFNGTTVDIEETFTLFKDIKITFSDIPGIKKVHYHVKSLEDKSSILDQEVDINQISDKYTDEELISINFLKNKDNYDGIVHIMDAKNLPFELLLLRDLIKLNKPIVVGVNFLEEADWEKINIECTDLTRSIGIPFIPIDPVNKINIETILKSIILKLRSNLSFRKTSSKESSEIIDIKKSDQEILNVLKKLIDKKSLKLINKRPENQNKEYKNANKLNNILQLIKSLFRLKNKDSDKINSIEDNVTPFINCSLRNQGEISNIDKILTNKYFGLPIFFTVIAVMFGTIYKLGEPLSDSLSNLTDFIFRIIASHIPDYITIFGKKISMKYVSLSLCGGISPGVSTIIEFIPRIILLNFWIMMLEMSGYMVRIAKLLEGILNAFGLPGNALFPIISGFGCSIMGYISTRTISGKDNRLASMLAVNFVPCHAQLVILLFFTKIFFPNHSGIVMSISYIASILIGLIVAKIYSLMSKGSLSHNTIHLPFYRVPDFKVALRYSAKTTLKYLESIFNVIIIFSLVIWILSHIQFNKSEKENYSKAIDYLYHNMKDIYSNKNLDKNNNIELLEINNITKKANSDESTVNYYNIDEVNGYLIENSLLGSIFKKGEKISMLIGLDWKLSLSILSGIMAREVSVLTLGVLYSNSSHVSLEDAVQNSIKSQVSFPSGISYIAAILLLSLCMAATLTFFQENKKNVKSAILSLFGLNLLNLIIVFFVYRIALIFYS